MHTDQLTYGVQATIERDRTLQLPRVRFQDRLVERPAEQLIGRLLEQVHPTRVWYLSWPGSRRGATGVAVLERHGFVVQEVQVTRTSALYLAVSDSRTRGRAMPERE